MKLETLATIFEMFFPGTPMQTMLDNDSQQVFHITDDHIKYSVLYIISLNHLEIYTHDLNVSIPGFVHVEGSPEDIIKLSKLLQ